LVILKELNYLNYVGLEVLDMGVRVRIRIKVRSNNNEVITSALVNSGYEVTEPEILLPRRLAEYLGLSLRPPIARTYTYETPTGYYRLLLIMKAVDVHLCDVCKEVKEVNVAVADFEREVLISDALCEALGIQILSARTGIWRHVNDEISVRRKSVKPEYW